MEIDITHLTTDDHDLMDYSASAAELGQDAGSITWSNSIKAASEMNNAGSLLVTTEAEQQDARDYLKGFGAWEAEEINSWSTVELNALILQLIAGDLRDFLDHKDDQKWQENHGGSIYRGDNGRVYYYLGN